MSGAYAVVWRYIVADDRREAFERVYGPDGAWARLFRRDEGYLGTELIRAEDGVYVTIDRWRDRASFDRLMAGARPEYEQLDEASDRLTASEELVGRGVLR